MNEKFRYGKNLVYGKRANARFENLYGLLDCRCARTRGGIGTIGARNSVALPRDALERRTNFEIYSAPQKRRQATDECRKTKMTLLETLRAFLKKRNEGVYLVGGAVRDVLLRRETHDLDVVVQGSASNVARAFADEIGAAYFLMDESFDVARVILENADGSHEIVDFARQRGDSMNADLATRDFTINALAADVRLWNGDANEMLDPFDGRADLAAQRVRVVSDNVFVNDAVRLLRAARMEAELNFVLDDATEALLKRDAPLIESAPMERVRDEFMKIIAAPNVLRNLKRLDALDLLGRVLPEVDALRGVTQSPPHVYEVFEHSLRAVAAAEETERAGYLNLAQGAFGAQLREHFSQGPSAARTRRELLRLALLLHDIGKPATRTVAENGRIRFLTHETVGAEMVGPALRRLKFSNEQVAHIKMIVASHMRPLWLTENETSDRAVHRFFRATGDVGVDVAVHAWCDQRAIFGKDADEPEIPALQAVIGKLLDRYYHAQTQVVAPPPLVNGNDVMQVLQIPGGPRIGELLDAVREAQAVGEVTTRQQALDLIARLARV